MDSGAGAAAHIPAPTLTLDNRLLSQLTAHPSYSQRGAVRGSFSSTSSPRGPSPAGSSPSPSTHSFLSLGSQLSASALLSRLSASEALSSQRLSASALSLSLGCSQLSASALSGSQPRLSELSGILWPSNGPNGRRSSEKWRCFRLPA